MAYTSFHLKVRDMKAITLLFTVMLIGALCLSVRPQTKGRGKAVGISALTGVTPQSSLRTPSGIELVMVPSGSFMMGSDHSQEDSEEGDERPVHRVPIKYSFYMGKYEVTQAQYRAVMGRNPSHNRGEWGRG
jgi:formylglycine-generating enzyme required for sulfatase activity